MTVCVDIMNNNTGVISSAIFHFNVLENPGDADTHQQEEQPTMSTTRKIALTLSIVNCIAFIIIFLWILPCDYDTCSAPAKVRVEDWEINLTGKGRIYLFILAVSIENKRLYVIQVYKQCLLLLLKIEEGKCSFY